MCASEREPSTSQACFFSDSLTWQKLVVILDQIARSIVGIPRKKLVAFVAFAMLSWFVLAACSSTPEQEMGTRTVEAQATPAARNETATTPFGAYRAPVVGAHRAPAARVYGAPAARAPDLSHGYLWGSDHNELLGNPGHRFLGVEPLCPERTRNPVFLDPGLSRRFVCPAHGQGTAQGNRAGR